jgi:heat shock protein HslJ
MSLRSNRFLTLAALIVTGSLGACAATAPAASPEPLWGSEWQLQLIGSQAALPQPIATLNFPQTGQTAGHGSCNRFSGTVEIDKDRLRFGPLISTKMACPGGASEQESRYLGALRGAQRYEVQGDTLLIHAQGMDQPLRFVRTTVRK